MYLRPISLFTRAVESECTIYWGKHCWSFKCTYYTHLVQTRSLRNRCITPTILTRNTARAPTSTAHSLRSMKQSSQALNSLANDHFCHVRLGRKFQENLSTLWSDDYKQGSRKWKKHPVSRGFNSTSQKCSRLFLVWKPTYPRKIHENRWIHFSVMLLKYTTPRGPYNHLVRCEKSTQFFFCCVVFNISWKFYENPFTVFP